MTSWLANDDNNILLESLLRLDAFLTFADNPKAVIRIATKYTRVGATPCMRIERGLVTEAPRHSSPFGRLSHKVT